MDVEVAVDDGPANGGIGGDVDDGAVAQNGQELGGDVAAKDGVRLFEDCLGVIGEPVADAGGSRFGREMAGFRIDDLDAGPRRFVDDEGDLEVQAGEEGGAFEGSGRVVGEYESAGVCHLPIVVREVIGYQCMTRRTLIASAAAAGMMAAPKVLKYMGTAGPGLGARIRSMGKQWDIVEYAHEKGLGAAHTTLPADLDAAAVKKLRNQIERYDMRLTVGLRTPRGDADLTKYEAAVKAASEMDGRVVCVHDPFSGRRYEQFKSAAEFHVFDAQCKAAVRRAEPILRKYKMPLAIENHKGWRSGELAEWVKSTGSEYVGVCLDLVNNVSLIETPQQTIDTLAPYTIFVSFKDIGVDFYSDGILLSEVAFGDGLLDLPGIVARFQKKDPKMLFQLEMLTRDPLKVPVFTEQYWNIYDEKSPAPSRDLAMLVGWIRNHPPKVPLPKTSGLTPAEVLALEDKLNQQCIDWARANLPSLA